MGIAELKALLSETLARVKAGEEVQITEHGRPIARLMPLSGASPAAATQELVRTGLVKAPEKTLDFEAFWKLPRAEFLRPRDPQDEDDVIGLWELREAV
ncbi:MAG TPA: type II toxin-antitoxin system prevent-host-death family antitoxin [Thermoanaerobaculia bacterium]|jgi:prevent-host-death family protein|nr:type II toxin-antitoxin system prevent-host-death family antitoxin [Thermoanaerobaculia bacterium]